jgi:hypothetical protein
MDTTRYLAYCGYTIVVGCVAGAFWFNVITYAGSKESGFFTLFPLYLVDSFLVGWFPALLFGTFLHVVMLRLGWWKSWQWALVGAGMAWSLFVAGGWIAKSGVFSILGLGLAILRGMSNKLWPAAICGAIVALILRPLAIRWANPLAPAKQTA